MEIQYKDFAAWHNRYIEDPEIKEKSHHYWLQILGNSLPPLELPRDVKINQSDETSGASAGYRFVVAGEIKEQLKKIAEIHHTSLFMVVFSAFNMLLARLSGQADIVCGIPSAGRELPGLQDIVGFFVNTVILRNMVDYEEPYTGYLERVNHNTMKALENQYYPLEKVLDDLKMKYPTIPVFFNMFNMNIEKAEKGTEKGTDKNFSSHIGKVQDVKFELVIYASERENGIDVDCHYRENLFTPQRVEFMMQQYVGILEAIANDPGKKVRDYLFKKERKKFINLGGLR
jgi:fengycin family lipopeptide synthetase D